MLCPRPSQMDGCCDSVTQTSGMESLNQLLFGGTMLAPH